jgi:two-component system, OmpR family, sensor histidine kinase BaeS
MMPKLTFRGHLLISHILPILLLVPLVGLALIYLLETRLIQPILASAMISQGILVEHLTYDQPDLWTSSSDAQTFLDSVDFERPSRIGLLTPDHVLLATSRPDDRVLIGKTISNLPDSNSLADPWWDITPGDLPGEQILDVLIPVKQADGQTIGLIRIYRRTTDIEQNVASMRLLVLGVLMVGLLITGAIAVFLSESVSRPLKTFTRTISESPLEGQAQLLPEEGDREFIDLSNAYNRLQERRQELEATRQEMLAGVIHEIGRPLGSLSTALHALQAGAVNNLSLRSDLMKGMSERIDRMGRLLEDLALTYRGLEPQEIHFRSVQVNEWLESLIPLWIEAARQKQQTWETTLPDNLPIIQTDPDRLAQVLDNLVSNAIKFTPNGGRISLMVNLVENKIQFWVIDTGIGIPFDEQRHLFAPFYRSVQPSWKAPGLGLGLSIAKSITVSLGGQIILTSNPGQGSTFVVSLPIS